MKPAMDLYEDLDPFFPIRPDSEEEGEERDEVAKEREREGGREMY